MAVYPILVGEMAKRGIKKKAIAQSIGICDKTLSNKMNGKVPFTWPEVCGINERFFPDMDKDTLFARNDDPRDSA